MANAAKVITLLNASAPASDRKFLNKLPFKIDLPAYGYELLFPIAFTGLENPVFSRFESDRAVT
jgi:hypothetical protein